MVSSSPTDSRLRISSLELVCQIRQQIARWNSVLFSPGQTYTESTLVVLPECKRIIKRCLLVPDETGGEKASGPLLSFIFKVEKCK